MLKKAPLHVTDHAVVRFCERVLGMDMEGVRRVIHDTCAGAHFAGASRVIIDGFKYEMREGAVVTVTHTNPGNLPSRTAQEQAAR